MSGGKGEEEGAVWQDLGSIRQGRLISAKAFSLLSDPSIILPGGADPELDMHGAGMALSPPRKTNGDKDLE